MGTPHSLGGPLDYGRTIVLRGKNEELRNKLKAHTTRREGSKKETLGYPSFSSGGRCAGRRVLFIPNDVNLERARELRLVGE